MAIKNGQTPGADEVMNAFGANFADNAQLLFNADLIGFDPNLNGTSVVAPLRVFYDTIKNNSNTDTTNSDIVDSLIFGANVSDDFEDASIDANIWTTATSGATTVTESGGTLNFNGSQGVANSASATADQINSIDFNTLSTILLKYQFINSGAIGSKSAKIIISDDSANDVTVKSYGTGSSTVTNDVRFEINPATNNVDVYTDDINGSGSATSVDITSLQDGDTWHIKFSIQDDNNAGSISAKVLFIRYLLNSVSAKDFVSILTTSNSTITNAILTSSDDTTFGSVDYFLSADNGSNYEAVTVNEIHRFSNTGTQLKLKATLNSTVDKVPILYHWAAKYNFY